MFDGNDCLTPSYFMVVAFKIPLSIWLFHSWASYLCSIEILRKAILKDTEFYCILISGVLLHFDISSCKFSVYCRWWHSDHNGLQTLWKISKIKSFIQQTILKNEILQCFGTLLLSLVNVCRCDQRNETSWCKFDNLIASFHCNRN